MFALLSTIVDFKEIWIPGTKSKLSLATGFCFGYKARGNDLEFEEGSYN